VNHDAMSSDTLSMVMFWVGAMFAFTPILVVGIIILTTRHLRKKQAKAGPQPTH
jgi:hypothetical protein